MIRTVPNLLALALTAAASTAAAAQVPAPAVALASAPVHRQAEAEALAQDAGEYARTFAVPLDEAERRLRAQGETIGLTDQLARLYADRLAGIALEHRPAFRIVVLLAGDEPVPGEVIRAGGTDVPIVFRTGAAATRAQIVAAIKLNQAAIRAALPHPPGMGVDQRTGELVVVVSGADVDLYGRQALADRFAAMTGVPVRIRAIDRTGLDLQAGADADAEARAVEGGARLVGVNPLDGLRYACTAGFAVTDGARTGIVTAAHCPDTLALVDADRRQIPLSFVGQWGWGYQDVQVNVAVEGADARPSPLFFANTAKTLARPVTQVRAAASTRAGDWVCHRGERTGYSCSAVELVDFAPAGDLCGGACLPTWITAAGPTCQGGDSGAPVFTGTAALGIVKGGSYRGDGSCAFYFYMSTDYLPTGWSLIEQAAAPDQPSEAIAATP